MRTMKGSDMEISVGNKQLHENKHAQCHSQSSEHITVIMKRDQQMQTRSSLRFWKESSCGRTTTLPGNMCDYVRVRLLKHMNFI